MKNDLGRPLLYLYLACFLGCIEPQEISVTDIAIAEPEISETSSITGVVSAYKQ